MRRAAFLILASSLWAGLLLNRSLEVDGWQRTYILFIPSDNLKIPWFFRKARSLPLLMVLHGGGGSGRGILKTTKGEFNHLAEVYGALVVYPDALAGHWNDGRNVYPSQKMGIDDVKFLLSIVERLSSEFSIDPTRIFITGHSNGAMMSYRMGCDAAEKIRAIAPVSSPMLKNTYLNCKPSSPVSLIFIMGTDDPIVPWEGGEVGFRGRKLGEVVSAEETFKFWGEVNKCKKRGKRVYLEDRAPEDGTKVWKESFLECQGRARVSLYGVEGGGHGWPGGISNLPEEIIGKTTRDIDACQVIWDFLFPNRR